LQQSARLFLRLYDGLLAFRVDLCFATHLSRGVRSIDRCLILGRIVDSGQTGPDLSSYFFYIRLFFIENARKRKTTMYAGSCNGHVFAHSEEL
jgi:hypothetical protein